MSTAAMFPLDEFSLPSGGVILKSSDGVEFKVYKNILALASSFFCQMFTLPQPESVDSKESETGTTDSTGNQDVQVVSVSESSSCLAILLRLILPLPPPILPGMSETGQVIDAQALVSAVDPVLAAALKYDMPVLVKDLSAKLLDAAELTLADGRIVDDTLALRVYVLACRHGLKEEARRAAHAALKGCVSDVFIEELHHISGAQYFQLVKFHNNMAEKVRSLLQMDKPPSEYYAKKCEKCDNRHILSMWNFFVYHALLYLPKSPKSSYVFTRRFQKSTIMQHRRCDCTLPSTWELACRDLQEEIETESIRCDIDLSKI